MDLNLYISALQRQPCLLKTNSTRVLVTWLVTLLLIICPSSYKARLNNLIGTANICPQIISPQWSNARPNLAPPTNILVGKFGLALLHWGEIICGTDIAVPIKLSRRALYDDGQMINRNVINHVTKELLGWIRFQQTWLPLESWNVVIRVCFRRHWQHIHFERGTEKRD